MMTWLGIGLAVAIAPVLAWLDVRYFLPWALAKQEKEQG